MTNWEIQGVRLDGKASIDAWNVWVNQKLTVTDTTTLNGATTINAATTINSTLAVDPNSGSNVGISISNSGAGLATFSIDSGTIQGNTTETLITPEGEVLTITGASAGYTDLKIQNTTSNKSRLYLESSALYDNTSVLNIEGEGGVTISGKGTLPSLNFYTGDTNAAFTGNLLTLKSLSESGGNFATGEVVVNEPGADIDFRVESDTVTDAFKVDASTDKVEVNTDFDITNTTTTIAGDIGLTGDITQTGNYGLTGDITASGTTQALTGSTAINLTGATTITGTTQMDGNATIDGTFKHTNTTTNTPIIQMADSSTTLDVWKFEYDAVNSQSVLKFNPGTASGLRLDMLDNFGNTAFYFTPGVTGTQIQSYYAKWRYRGGNNHISYENAGGSNMAKLNMTAGNNFYEQYEGDWEFNPNMGNNSNFRYNSITYPSAGVPLFGLTEGTDTINMSGSIFATNLEIINEPLKQYEDTTANLDATKLTRDGEIAYSSDDEMFVSRVKTGKKIAAGSTVMFTYAENMTSWNWGSLGLAFVSPAGVTTPTPGGWVSQGYIMMNPFRMVSLGISHENGPAHISDYNTWRISCWGEDAGGAVQVTYSTSFRTEGLTPGVTSWLTHKGFDWNETKFSSNGDSEYVDPTDTSTWVAGAVAIGVQRFGSNASTSTATAPGWVIANAEIENLRILN